MSLHRCSTAECPFVGQATNKGCGCHQTDEQVLRATNADLLAALQACAESLAFARDKLGMCGEGDGADRKADADDTIGSLPALLAARAAITKAGG